MRGVCKTLLLAASVALTATAGEAGWIDFNKNGRKDVYEDPAQPVETRVADLLSQMTLEEKTCQLVTLYGSGRVLKDAQPTAAWTNEVWKDGIANIDEELNGVGPMFKEHPELICPFSNHVAAVGNVQRWFVERTRLGIPVDFSNEGIHGLNHTKATPLPAPIGIGSTWNRALVREAGEIVGREAKLIGYSNVYAPILDVARDQRWGRTLECYGEDPYLVGALGVEMTKGIQSQGVGSTLKHYVAYGVPKGGRDASCRTDPHVTPRDLHEIFLAPFAKVVREAKPMGVMCSYNDWNGEPVAASRYFLTDLLRTEYGFDGYVVSDSEAVEFVQTKHAVAETYAEACAQVLEAGLNVRTHFTPPEDFVKGVREAIASGRLPMSVIDRRVAEVLSVKFRLGLFDSPYLGDAARADREAGMAKHLDFADRLQAESFVLLKNNGILPLDREKTRRILVTGPLAAEANYMTSRYGPNDNPVVTVLDGLKAHVGDSVEIVYEKGCATADAKWPESEIVPTPLTADEEAGIVAAAKAGAGTDVIVAVLGEDERTCGESRSRTSLELPGRQQQLLDRLLATGKPIVVVLVNGQPLTVNVANRKAAAILETWFPGARGGVQIAKTLFGEVNPSGKLTVTFPKSVGQIEYNFPFKKGSHGQQSTWMLDPNGFGYTRVQGALYPFGYGLSYTSFAYANLEVKAKGEGEQRKVFVSVDVTNTGTRDGAEVAQLYVRDLFSSVVTYDSVLRGFEKVFLKSGETKRVSFTLTADDLKILGRDMKWTVEPGDFEVLIGASSEDIRLKSRFTVPSSAASTEPSAPDRYFAAFAADDPEPYANAVSNRAAAAFLKANVPDFECPDETLTRAYWFRWWTFRKHLRITKDGRRVITEFLPNVGWAGKENTISCPLGHHIREGRWLGGGAWAQSHLAFMLKDGFVTGRMSYANWPALDAENLEAVTGDPTFANALLPQLVKHYRDWEKGWPSWNGVWHLKTNGLFRIQNGSEGMEISPNEYGARPIVNSAMCANARSIARLAARTGDAALAKEFEAKAAALEEGLRTRIWNPERKFFTLLDTNGVVSSECELNGYAPWYFGVDTRGCDAAWRYLTSTNHFAAPVGLTSLERCSKAFRLDYAGHECQWNGPTWPYATAMTLTALANYLRAGGTELGKDDFVRLLRQYAASHRRTLEDGRTIDWIDENQNPFTGDWIARTVLRMRAAKKGAKPFERGKDYNHSTFCDLVISELCGIRPKATGPFEVKPMIPDDWDWFALRGLVYHGERYDIFFDRTGRKYGLGKGIVVRKTEKGAR